MSPVAERVPCPSCGGAGGGPFGRAGGAWDDEDYVCPRCEGVGMLVLEVERPGIVKASTSTAAETERKKTG